MSRSPSVGGTLKYLDDVVGNPLRHAWLQGAAHGCLNGEAGGILDDVFDADKIEHRKARVRLDLHQYVEIAIRPGVTTRPRSENREPRHSFGLQRRSGGTDRGDDLIAGHKII